MQILKVELHMHILSSWAAATVSGRMPDGKADISATTQ